MIAQEMARLSALARCDRCGATLFRGQIVIRERDGRVRHLACNRLDHEGVVDAALAHADAILTEAVGPAGETCPRCGGAGEVEHDDGSEWECMRCDGTGVLPEEGNQHG